VSLDRFSDQTSGRRHNHGQKQKIYDDLLKMGAGYSLERNPDYRRDAAGQEEFIEMPIVPPLDKRENGVVTIDKHHPSLKKVKQRWGKEARDAVIRCRKEQIAHNDSGNYSAGTHVMDPETDLQMLPAEIVRRMAVWLPGCVKVKLYSSSEVFEYVTLEISDDASDIKQKLKEKGMLELEAPAQERRTKIYIKRMQCEGAQSDTDRVSLSASPGVPGDREELLDDGETLEEKVDVSKDIKAGKLEGFELAVVLP